MFLWIIGGLQEWWRYFNAFATPIATCTRSVHLSFPKCCIKFPFNWLYTTARISSRLQQPTILTMFSCLRPANISISRSRTSDENCLVWTFTATNCPSSSFALYILKHTPSPINITGLKFLVAKAISWGVKSLTECFKSTWLSFSNANVGTGLWDPSGCTDGNGEEEEEEEDDDDSVNGFGEWWAEDDRGALRIGLVEPSWEVPFIWTWIFPLLSITIRVQVGGSPFKHVLTTESLGLHN